MKQAPGPLVQAIVALGEQFLDTAVDRFVAANGSAHRE